MQRIPLAISDYRRRVPAEALALTKNRYFEQNPMLNPEVPVALIARPGLRKVLEGVGSGPIRRVYSAPGAFNGDLFVVSGLTLFRVANDGTVTEIGDLASANLGDVSMAATGNIGTTPEYLFITEGGVLWVYLENGYANSQLTADGAISAADTVEIDGVYYEFTAGSVDAGTPAGTLANPWLVDLGATIPEALQNLFNAINDTGVSGTDYSTALTAHATCVAYAYTATQVYVRYDTLGTAGNTITTTETGANLAWSGATMSGGGSPTLQQVPTPDDVGIIAVAHINSFIIAVPAQGAGINGRFYWIEPGEVEIDPLNFATAERSPDAILNVLVYSDQFQLLGENTSESWVMTGDTLAPVQRVQGVLFDRGVWEGTSQQVKESVIVVDSDGSVLQIAGGLNKISTPQVSERIRRAMRAYEASL